MRIIVDGMGGDNAPAEIVKGAVLAANEINDTIVLVGQENLLRAELEKNKYTGTQIEIEDAPDVITNHDTPVRAVRTKKQSSMVVGINMIKEGRGDVFVSAGNTGALMAGGLFILGRIQGIDRPAIASIYPILGTKHPSLLVDAGANAECKPNNMLEFGTMGSIYMEKVLGVQRPKVGLVNIGAEETKGTTMLKAAHELLEKSRLHFVGNVEARDLPHGACDVIVCDGFVGNIVLKLTEGLAMKIVSLLKKKFTAGMKAKLGALFLLDKMKEIKSEFDYSEYGGAPILGVKGHIVKMHGSSDAKAVKNTIIKAIPYANENVVEIIQNSVLELEEIIISE
ncbi:MAG: phosphate acyltransferase PlsX [Clostridia bacterium]|nr:phosphate acyltransferase PlsX [Clostridia bacterium]